jgi:DNA polymerase-3 subunit alpha
MATDFVHLHNHSHYSLLDGAVTVQDLVTKTHQLGMKALALTDHGAMFGAIEFYKAALANDVRPIIGCEMYLAPDDHRHKTKTGPGAEAAFHLILLAKDEVGYHNLMKLSSIAYLDGFYYKPRIDKQLLQEYHEGLICLTACLKGEVPQAILHRGTDVARSVAGEYHDIFGEDFYLEIQSHGLPEEEHVNPAILQISRDLDIPVVATNDTHYLEQEHAEAQDLLLCIQTGKNREDRNRLRFATNTFYLKSPQEMEQLFHQTPQALTRTAEVAEKCNLVLHFNQKHLPRFPLPRGEESLDGYLSKLAREGLRRRFPEPDPDMIDRLEHELKVINQMGYSGYFLIVRDFVKFAKDHGIPVGPGRGSAAGSLVSYCLEITDLNPLKYGLIFERFLNPDRISMPDIDIDFSDDGRAEVIQYVKEKYDENNVTQIITFGKMLARQVVRDVGRVIGLAYGEVDKIAKLIPHSPNMTIKKALSQVAELRELVDSSPEYQELIQHSLVLEGLNRNAGTHAAGVVITPGELTEYLPLYRNSDQEITSQYDMNTIESIGLLKMDFLGLRTLTVIQNTLKLLAKKGLKISLDHIPLDDPDTFRLFGEGETVGVFQFESSGMREHLVKLKPERLDDLIAMNALYRPGPMDMIADFIRWKHGDEKIEYIHPVLEPILSETYGVIVYQEQVIQIVQEVAGMSLAKADMMRRAMGKKKPEEMLRLKEEFIEGAQKHKKLTSDQAEALFDLIGKFSRYGFVKSHSACYALVAYHTAYLKTHHPVEFMAASLTSEMGNSDRMSILIDECRRMGISVLPPDVNLGDHQFTVREGEIRFGLGAVKNVGEAAIQTIVETRRKQGPYNSLYDLVEHVDLRQINRKVLESLIRCGAADSLEGHRAQQLAALDEILNYGNIVQEDRLRGQTSLFMSGGDEAILPRPPLPDVPEWSTMERLTAEKELLGFYVSGHPLDRYRSEVKAFSTYTFARMSDAEDGASVRAPGIITSVKRIMTKNAKPMAFITLEDFTGSIEVIVFPECLEKVGKLIQEDQMVVVLGRVSTKENEGAKVIADEIISLADARERFTEHLLLEVDESHMNDDLMDKMESLFQKSPGSVNVFFKVKPNSGNPFTVRSNKYRVSSETPLINHLRQLLGDKNVKIVS